MVRAYIGLGSNLGNPAAAVSAGIESLRRLPDSRVAQCSSLYRSAPVGIAAQPDFVNAACALDTDLPAEQLMRLLLEIESRHGRRREGASGGPRTLDLDLLMYGDVRSEAPDVTLPHPRLHERAFVLYPLIEIAPALQVPGRGSVVELLRGCSGQTVERLREKSFSAG